MKIACVIKMQVVCKAAPTHFIINPWQCSTKQAKVEGQRIVCSIAPFYSN